MTAIQPYAVPLISGDLRRAEMVKQFADVFEYMDVVSQDMFNRIAIRLNVYRAQLNKFDERIQHAHANIERIKGSRRAIQVHSSARYPVEQNRSTYKSIFEHDSEKDEHKPPVLHYNLFRLNETVDKFVDPNDKGSKSNDETLVVLKQYESNSVQKTKRNVLVGLGRPPANIKSVVSFLKYNTQENPYTQPTKIDPLSVKGRRKANIEQTQPRISEAPAPIFYQQKSERPQVGGISYNPLLGLVPEITVPDNLELPNFAIFDDNTAMDWTKQQMPSIAPSYVIAMLPDMNDLSGTSATSAPVEPPKPAAPAPPPPVDIPAIIPLTSAAPPAPGPPPPPAPPLPPSLPSTLPPPPPNTDESQLPTDNPLPLGGGGGGGGGDDDDDDGGNPLLAEIRNFGKKRTLKPATKSDPLDAPPAPSPKGGESMMDALKKRLEKRRGFIAGEDSSSKPAAAEKTIAAPTPPPLPSTGGTFTDAIAAKAREVADAQQRQKDDSDNASDDDDWE